MTAPALILLAPGTHEARAAEALHRLRKKIQMLRPDMQVSLAFLDTCPPSGPQVVSVLASRGITEMVFVPLDLTSAMDAGDMVAQVVQRARLAHPSVAFSLARPVGPAVELLNILDATLREALSAQHCSEVDALVLSTAGCGDVRGAALVSRRARQWASHHKLPVLVSTADGHGMSVSQAIGALRGQGRRHIAVGSLWVAPDEAYLAQARQATAAGAVAVSSPFADLDQLIDLVLGRYAFAAMELLTDELFGLGVDDIEASAEGQ